MLLSNLDLEDFWRSLAREACVPWGVDGAWMSLAQDSQQMGSVCSPAVLPMKTLVVFKQASNTLVWPNKTNQSWFKNCSMVLTYSIFFFKCFFFFLQIKDNLQTSFQFTVEKKLKIIKSLRLTLKNWCEKVNVKKIDQWIAFFSPSITNKVNLRTLKKKS